jgi:hypothetical protein
MAIYRARAYTTNYFNLLAIFSFFNMFYLVFDALHATTGVANAGARCTEAIIHTMEM